MVFGIIVGFVAGALVAYKYPEQVGKAVDAGKKLFSDLKDKVMKKDTPAA